MQTKLLSYLGILIAVAGVLSSPEFGALVPQVAANIAMLVGAVAAAVGKGIVGSTESKSVTILGVVIAVLGVFASPEFTNIVTEKWASFASLLGALIAAAGASLFPKPTAK